MWEEAVMHWMDGIGSPMLDSIMSAITGIATHAIVWFAICFLMLFGRRSRRYVVPVVISIVLAYVISDFILKPCIDRVRPFEELGLEIIVSAPVTSSFPSGHTASSFAAAVALWFYDRRLGIPAVTLAALVAVSRVYLLVHWPTDVIAGAILGIVCAVAVHIIWSRMVPEDAQERC